MALEKLMHQPNEHFFESHQIEFLTEYFDLSVDLVAIINQQSKTIITNLAWDQFFNQHKKRNQNTSILEHVHPDDLEVSTEILRRLFNKTCITGFINRCKRADGEYRKLEWRGQANDEVALITARDVTEVDKLSNQIVLLNQRLNLAVLSTQDGIWDWDLSTNKVYYSDRWFEILGYKSEEHVWEFEIFQELLYKQDIKRVAKYTDKFIKNEIDVFDIEFRMHHKLGHLVWIRTKATAIRDENNIATRLVGSNSDITELKRLYEQIELDRLFYKNLIESIRESVWVYNFSLEKFTYVSPNTELMMGYPVEPINKLKLEDIFRAQDISVFKQILEGLVSKLKRQPKSHVRDVFEIQLERKDYGLKWVEVSVNLSYNIHNQIIISGVTRDIESRKKTLEKIEYNVNHDILTGLYNRRKYEEDLIALNKKEYLPLTCVVMDINGLKMINDAFGHKVGDTLIITLANIIKESISLNACCYRIGGDEFVAIMTNTNQISAEQIVANMQKKISKNRINHLPISLSCGIAVKESVSMNIEFVIKAAEVNMYQVKTIEGDLYRSKLIDYILGSLLRDYHWELGHSERVSRLCEAVAKHMGLDQRSQYQLKIAGKFHDIGKIAIDKQIMLKTCPYDENELIIMKRHTEVGYYLLRSSSKYAFIAETVLHSHERCDGSGYPKGLVSEQIPLNSKILGAVEVYDAMLSTLPGCSALSKKQALEELKSLSDSQFDHDVVNAIVEIESTPIDAF